MSAMSPVSSPAKCVLWAMPLLLFIMSFLQSSLRCPIAGAYQFISLALPCSEQPDLSQPRWNDLSSICPSHLVLPRTRPGTTLLKLSISSSPSSFHLSRNTFPFLKKSWKALMSLWSCYQAVLHVAMNVWQLLLSTHKIKIYFLAGQVLLGKTWKAHHEPRPQDAGPPGSKLFLIPSCFDEPHCFMRRRLTHFWAIASMNI